MITEPTHPELRQKWARDHEWVFILERDKLIMDATEKGNHFHNDVPLEQIDPYESEEKFYYLNWPSRLHRFGMISGFGFAYIVTMMLLFLDQPEGYVASIWTAASISLLSFVAAGIGFGYLLKYHRRLLRFYHRMTGMELFAIFAELPDKTSAAKFLAALKKEVPPWSHTFAGPSKTENMARELKALHQLHLDKVLNDSEFQFKKRELLSEYFHHGREAKSG